ncbi:MAG: hypothetical protein RLZZ227_802 [Pseudomonadota bacterium]|jgi:hypothetical protein
MDKRSEPRVKLLYVLKVYNRHTREVIGQVLDITSQGFNLLCRDYMQIGEMHECVLELPGEDYGKTSVKVDIECRWRKHDTTPGFFSSGFHFRKISLEQRGWLQRLMSDCARSPNLDFLLA